MSIIIIIISMNHVYAHKLTGIANIYELVVP